MIDTIEFDPPADHTGSTRGHPSPMTARPWFGLPGTNPSKENPMKSKRFFLTSLAALALVSSPVPGSPWPRPASA